MILDGDVDTIRIAFDEGSQTLLRIVIAGILFGIALDTRVATSGSRRGDPASSPSASVLQFLVLPALTFRLTLLSACRARSRSG